MSLVLPLTWHAQSFYVFAKLPPLHLPCKKPGPPNMEQPGKTWPLTWHRGLLRKRKCKIDGTIKKRSKTNMTQEKFLFFFWAKLVFWRVSPTLEPKFSSQKTHTKRTVFFLPVFVAEKMTGHLIIVLPGNSLTTFFRPALKNFNASAQARQRECTCSCP